MTSTARFLVKYWLPVAVMVGIIAIESTNLMSGEHTGSLLTLLLAPFHLSADFIAKLNHLLRKAGHCIGFGLLAILFFRAYRATFARHGHQVSLAVSALLGLACAALVATADELHQMTIPSRTGTWWDILLDSTAAAVAVCLASILLKKTARPLPR